MLHNMDGDDCLSSSIYDIICRAMDEHGVISADFSLPEEGPDTLTGLPGAKDGILLYHTDMNLNPDVNDSEGIDMVIDIIRMASEGFEEDAMEVAATFAAYGFSALVFMETMCNYVADHMDELNANGIFHTASLLVTQGEYVEAVKLGLILFQLFDLDDETKDIVRTFARCEEFALFAGALMTSWPDCDRDFINALQSLHGWGKIHMIRQMPAVSMEASSMLLLNGAANDVDPSYSALEVFHKCGFMKWAKAKNLRLPYYRGLASVLSALLRESPIPGLGALDNKEEVVWAFFDATSDRDDLEMSDMTVVVELYDYLDKHSWIEGYRALQRALAEFMREYGFPM